RITGRDLAVADYAIERCAHLGALELLTSRDYARARRFAVALRRVATDLRIFQILRRHEVLLAQLGGALELTLRLLIGLYGRLRRSLCGGERVADRRIVEAHEEIALADRVAILLEHRQHHRRHLRSEVRAPLRLHRARDGRPGRERIAADGEEVLGRDEERRRGSGLGIAAIALVAPAH